MSIIPQSNHISTQPSTTIQSKTTQETQDSRLKKDTSNKCNRRASSRSSSANREDARRTERKTVALQGYARRTKTMLGELTALLGERAPCSANGSRQTAPTAKSGTLLGEQSSVFGEQDVVPREKSARTWFERERSRFRRKLEEM